MRFFTITIAFAAITLAAPVSYGPKDKVERDGTTQFDPDFGLKAKRDGTTQFDPDFGLKTKRDGDLVFNPIHAQQV